MLSLAVLPDDTLLQALLKDSLNGLILYQIVRDETGRPIDFRYQQVNPAAATLLGSSPEDLVGRSCQQVFPQGNELRSYYRQVANTGQNMRVDYQLPEDGRWFDVFITQQAQQTLLCFFTDITDRVQAEQELIKNLTLLQKTEELAAIGSWDYDRTADRFFWSEGMYRLFGMEFGAVVSLQTVIDSAIEADQPVACRIVDKLQRSTLPFEDVMRIRRNGQVGTVKVKGIVMPDEHGQPVWVMGVYWDITEEQLTFTKIQQTAKNLQALLDCSPSAMALLKAIHNQQDTIIDFCVDVCNQKFATMAGQSTNQLIGQSVKGLANLLWGKETLSHLQHVSQTNQPFHQKRQQDNTDNRWLELSVTRQDNGLVLTIETRQSEFAGS